MKIYLKNDLIILFGGRMQVGKTTSALFAQEYITGLEISSSKLAFADKIKQGFQNSVFKKGITSSDKLTGNVQYLISDARVENTDNEIYPMETNPNRE